MGRKDKLAKLATILLAGAATGPSHYAGVSKDEIYRAVHDAKRITAEAQRQVEEEEEI